jgi:hypothetical protein
MMSRILSSLFINLNSLADSLPDPLGVRILEIGKKKHKRLKQSRKKIVRKQVYKQVTVNMSIMMIMPLDPAIIMIKLTSYQLKSKLRKRSSTSFSAPLKIGSNKPRLKTCWVLGIIMVNLTVNPSI